MKRQANSYNIKVYSETLPGDVIDRKRDNEEDIGEEDLITETEEEVDFDNLYELVDWLERETGFNLEGNNGSYYTIDTQKDMYTGDEVNYSYHLEGLDKKEEKLVDECVEKEKNLVPDPTDFDTDEEWEKEIEKLKKAKRIHLSSKIVESVISERVARSFIANNRKIVLTKEENEIIAELEGYFSGSEYLKVKQILTESGFDIISGTRGRTLAGKKLKDEVVSKLMSLDIKIEDHR
mgnify:CR=1 FL=1